MTVRLREFSRKAADAVLAGDRPGDVRLAQTIRRSSRRGWRSTSAPLDADKSLRHAMHVDVSVARAQAEARVAAALAAGGRIVDDADAPAGWILADRAGNRVCIAAWPDGSVPASPADSQ